MGTVAACFGLAPAAAGAVICAWTDTPVATIINVAVSIDLMKISGSVANPEIKHISNSVTDMRWFKDQ